MGGRLTTETRTAKIDRMTAMYVKLLEVHGVAKTIRLLCEIIHDLRHGQEGGNP
jgi:hypothetical protein